MARSTRLQAEWIPIAFLAVLALILAAAAITWENAREVPAATAWVTHTLQVEEGLKGIEASMLNVETNQRAFVLTGKPEFFTRFNALTGETNGVIDEIARLTADNPVQQENVKSLRSIWEQKITEMRKVVHVRSESGLEAGASRVGEGLGIRLMAQAQKLLGAMRDEEAMLLVRRTATTDASLRRAVVSFILSTLVGVALLVGLAVLFTRIAVFESRRREADEIHRIALQEKIKETERARRSEARVLEELQRSNRELQDFAFVASHDLQEPLRKIIAFGDRVKTRESDRLTPQGVDYLQRSINAAERMQGLIESLLDFSRVTSKAQPLVPTNLNTILRDVADDLLTRIERTGAKVNLGPMPTIDADAIQLRQLFQNLIGNALKFTKEGQIPVVDVTAEEIEEERWRIRVQDNGIGFDPKYADKIFTIFQRLHGRQEYEGNGIGLAIVRKIVERHGGEISATSAPGAGATFEIILPTHKTDLSTL